MSEIVSFKLVQHSLDWPEQVDGHIIRIEQRLNNDSIRWNELATILDDIHCRLKDLESSKKKRWYRRWF